MSSLSRRVAIAGGAVLLLGGATYGISHVGCALGERRAAERLDRPDRLFAMAPRIRDIERVGRAVLAGDTPIAPETLLHSLAARPDIRAACAVDCAPTRIDALGATFRAEMREGAFVVAANWVLAASEARIAALWVLNRDHVGAVNARPA
ncbi:MAG: hypothetical protein AAGB05_16025 [Pseudomonadota bacterium]